MKRILTWGVIIGFLLLPSVQAVSITSIGWNGEYWLISSYGDGEYRLVRFDGETFERIKLPSKAEDFEDSIIKFHPRDINYYLGFTPSVLGWFNDHWLLAGAERIARFDGENFNVTSYYPPLHRMTCGRSYCLIVGDSKPGMAAHRVLLKYNGADFVDLTGQLSNVTPYVIAVSTGDEDEQWLIASYGWSSDPEGNITATNELLKYGGETFEKTTALPPRFFAYSMGYNGEYWLLTDSQQIMKYSNGRFTDLAGQVNVTWGFNKWKNDIAWGDDYWLINMGGHLLKYDGSRFIDLEAATVDAMGWNGDYWLIGGRFDSSVLMKYDGSSFTDLTGEFMRAGQAKPPSPPPPPPTGYTEAVLALLILAVIVSLVLTWKAKSRGALLGAAWGAVGPILYWALADTKLFGIKTLLQIIALPMFVYSKIFIPEAAPGGSFYYSPIMVSPFSIALGALIGYAAGKIYDKVK